MEAELGVTEDDDNLLHSYSWRWSSSFSRTMKPIYNYMASHSDHCNWHHWENLVSHKLKIFLIKSLVLKENNMTRIHSSQF